MELTEEKLLKAKKYNEKLFPIYKMFSWDLLFYYSISFLFLTQNKGLTASQILFADSFYPIFKLIFQIPCVNVVEIVGKRKSLIIANVFIMLSILALILGNGIIFVIISNALMAFGYTIKDICEPLVLNDCITDTKHPRTTFSNIDGKGSAYWYYLDAITATICGFLYVFNNYIPIFLCLAMCIIACLLSFKFMPFEDTSKRSSTGETKSFKVYFKDLKIAFRNIFKSNRLKALLLFSGIFSALLKIRLTIASSLFTEIGLKEEYFGIVFAALTVLSGISSKYQDFYHKKFRNTLLTKFSLAFSISMVITGLTSIICKNFTVTFIIVFIMYAVQYVIKGPYHTLIKRYLNSFSSPSMETKIYSANTLIESSFSTLIYWASSLLLDVIPTSFAVVILGCIFTIILIFILDYMKTRIGLKPEEYKKSDIYFTEIH